MKIASYNVNGIRAAVGKGFLDWLQQTAPDVVCLQETKAQPEQIPTMEFQSLGYHSYYFSAQKKGYSGVAILCKQKPDHVEIGMNIDKYDYEGRLIRADFGDLSVISVYHPSGTSGDERQAFKMQWLEDFHIYIKELEKTRPKLAICGDFNICHEAIDIHDPKGNAKSSGFLPEERQWIDGFINDGFIDTFRFLHPEDAHNYSWWSYRFNARSNNKGWRIDYIMLTENLKQDLLSASIMPEALQSDHCPIFAEIK
ncbi:MAG: exodeoxyribonuclease III [Bacteroidales bacterium]|jgi:exodeoxyribonuclease-3|nr:exodeoxyribonuclease III [Bacteroidales bacterium]